MDVLYADVLQHRYDSGAVSAHISLKPHALHRRYVSAGVVLQDFSYGGIYAVGHGCSNAKPYSRLGCVQTAGETFCGGVIDGKQRGNY